MATKWTECAKTSSGSLCQERLVCEESRYAGPLLDALGETYDAACEGSAFYALQSCCNHSCAPNAYAFKRAQVDTDGSAVVLAKRAIASGEEVCICPFPSVTTF